ncbi:MAG: hypothetical protein QN183_14430 [Armatimonadota bacterium]|nr:hypothetical protein [Armatimonadota bacterium]MDR7486845.1 hypothetical protein [Armatimonadota bacterium]MDR7532959.1 hypothetical protein [Armatimonadota bacterium]MDR7537543.1 hypothetical protein [Armatimonadota bacterium]
MEFKAFLRYWSLTLAVFVFYLFAFLVAAIDLLAELSEASRKKRAGARGQALDPNPLATRSLAQTLLPGPGQRLDEKRQWVADLARDVVSRAGVQVNTVVLEDSKGHPLVHFTDGKTVQSYRVDRALVDAAMAGDASKVKEIADYLARHLRADFLGREDERPPRTTELAREAGSKAPPAAAARPASGVPEGAGEASATAGAPSQNVSAPPAAPVAQAAGEKPVEQMSREERLAAARARAEELRRQRLAQGRQSDKPAE